MIQAPTDEEVFAKFKSYMSDKNNEKNKACYRTTGNKWQETSTYHHTDSAICKLMVIDNEWRIIQVCPEMRRFIENRTQAIFPESAKEFRFFAPSIYSLIKELYSLEETENHIVRSTHIGTYPASMYITDSIHEAKTKTWVITIMDLGVLQRFVDSDSDILAIAQHNIAKQ